MSDDGEYTIRLKLSNGREADAVFRTKQNPDGTWYATASGAIGGCSRDYPIEMESILALINAECATLLYWC